MPFAHIKAFLTKITETDAKHSSDYVTSTDIGATKRALDVISYGGFAEILSLADSLIKGTCPEVNWDQIYRITVSSTAQTLGYAYNGSVQFYIDGTVLDGDFNIEFRSTSAFTLETNLDVLLLESGDKLLQE